MRYHPYAAISETKMEISRHLFLKFSQVCKLRRLDATFGASADINTPRRMID